MSVPILKSGDVVYQVYATNEDAPWMWNATLPRPVASVATRQCFGGTTTEYQLEGITLSIPMTVKPEGYGDKWFVDEDEAKAHAARKTEEYLPEYIQSRLTEIQKLAEELIAGCQKAMERKPSLEAIGKLGFAQCVARSISMKVDDARGELE